MISTYIYYYMISIYIYYYCLDIRGIGFVYISILARNFPELTVITCVRLFHVCTSFPCTCVLHRLSVRCIHATDTIFLLHGVERSGRICRFISCRLSVRATLPYAVG